MALITEKEAYQSRRFTHHRAVGESRTTQRTRGIPPGRSCRIEATLSQPALVKNNWKIRTSSPRPPPSQLRFSIFYLPKKGYGVKRLFKVSRGGEGDWHVESIHYVRLQTWIKRCREKGRFSGGAWMAFTKRKIRGDASFMKTISTLIHRLISQRMFLETNSVVIPALSASMSHPAIYSSASKDLLELVLQS